MTVKVKSKNYSLSFSGEDFLRFRTQIAMLTDTWLGNHYTRLPQMIMQIANLKEIDRDAALKQYDLLWHQRIIRHPELVSVASFIYQSDIEGTLSWEMCNTLFHLLNQYHGISFYASVESDKIAVFPLFQEMLADCVKNRYDLTWISEE